MLSVLKHPAFYGALSTVGVVIFAYFLGAAEIAEGQTRFDAFMNAPANEVGDTLAGFAGTLAFVWIIVTVWLQALELKAQREELRLTRSEMEEQRKATQDMARSMQAQAAIFEGEQRERNEDRAQLEFESLLSNIRKWVMDRKQDDDFFRWAFDLNTYFDLGDAYNDRIGQYTKYDAVTNDDQFFELLNSGIQGRIYSKGNDEKNLFNGSVQTEGLLDIRARLIELVAYGERLSRAQLFRLDTLRLEATIEILDEVISNPTAYCANREDTK